MTFLGDFEMQLKVLIALPLLILAEVTVQQRLPRIVRLFLERGLIPDAARPGFDAAVATAMRLRNSVVVELLLILFVYLFGVVFVWRTRAALGIVTWYTNPPLGFPRLSAAGWWAACVSLPMYQFLLMRWYFRLLVWGRFLWQVSRLKLNLRPTHPDGTAGLRFLSEVSGAYTFVLLAAGVNLAGALANPIFYTGANLLSFSWRWPEPWPY